MRAWIVLFTALYACAVGAADWVYFAENGDDHFGNRIFLDKASIVVTGNYRKVWLKLAGYTIKSDGTATPTGHDSMQLWKLNCHERTYVIVTMLDDGHDLSRMIEHLPVDIQPESWMAMLHSRLCK